MKMHESVDRENVETWPTTNEPGDRWVVLKETSPSGKTMFQCLCCGDKFVTTQKFCMKNEGKNPPANSLSQRVPREDCAYWQRVKLRRYHLPSEKFEGWATIVIGDDGYFSAISDFGNYAFRWTHYGDQDFRQFLLRMHESWDYFCSKLGSQEFDGPATKRAIEVYILEQRREQEYTKEEAADLWEDLHSGDFESETDFIDWSRETTIEEPWQFHTQSYPTHLQIFTKITMKRLNALLEKELKKEGLPCSPL